MCSSDLRADDLRKDPGLEEIVQDMAARVSDRADLVGGRLRHAGEPVHVRERIALPAHARDLLVIMRISVGADVEAGDLLRAQEAGDRILVLLAVA